MDGFKDFILHKWTLLVAAAVTTQLASHITVLLTADKVQDVLEHIFVNPTLKPEASEYLKASIGSIVMILGMSVFHWLHTKFILPQFHPPQPASPTNQTSQGAQK